MKLTSLFTTIVLVFCLAMPAMAKELSKSQAVARALGKYPGKVLSAKTQKAKNGKVYRIKLMTKDGRVKTVKVNAKTGKVSK